MSGQDVMETLILSCSTGGGHHAAAEAMQEEMMCRGHHVDFLDPYTLSGTDRDEKIGNCYVKCAQKMPGVFGGIYRIGNLYRRLPWKSPVYWANRRTADDMQEYLKQHAYDVILTTHIFPGEILTHLKRRGALLPKMVYIATDYTCIPFTEETECDYYIVPSPGQKQEFCSWGIPPEKVVSIGIPVKHEFKEEMSREKALELLGLHPGKRYILMAGGSIGAGELFKAVGVMRRYLEEHRETILIVMCGTNQKLYKKLKKRYQEEPQILLLKKTECMAEYLKACDFYISKPGGLSSTEAAVSHTPLLHIPPIPGCESKNVRFFAESGMSICVSDMKKELLQSIQKLENREITANMRQAQRKTVDPFAAEKIADFIEEIV